MPGTVPSVAFLLMYFIIKVAQGESREPNGVAKVKLSNDLQSGDMMPAGNKTESV